MKWLAALILLIIPGNIVAQDQEKSVEAIVKNTAQEPLAGATIRLMRIEDAAPVRSTTTNAMGKFIFTGLSNGEYILSASYVGCKPVQTTITITRATQPVLVLPGIFLSSEKEKLEEVVVIAKRPLIQQDIDKTIVNVEAIPGASGNSAYELLGKSPGVIADENGNIKLNGKGNILVLIDDRQLYMSGQDLVTYLQSIPGTMLEQFELMDNPAARYDAAGGAVINIRLKKSRQSGLTGNINAGISQGRTFRTNESLNLNYNAGKMNWFGNISYGRGGNYVVTDQHREYLNADGAMTSALDLYNKSDFQSHNVMARAGLDYSISSKTIIGIQVRGQSVPRKENFKLVTENLDDTFMLDAIHTGNSDGKTDWKSYSVNLNFQQKFRENVNELLVDLNYIKYSSDGNQKFENDVHFPGTTTHSFERFYYHLISGVHIYNFKADYTHQFKNKLSLEAGVKLSAAKNDNDSRHYDITNNGRHPDYHLSNHFLYDENINAAYLSARKSGERWGGQAGLRIENTIITGNQLGNPAVQGSRFTQNFTNFFPGLFFNYKPGLSGKNNFNLSYTNRIARAPYHLFNPFMVFRDPYSSSAGNPDLKPVYRHNIELVWQHQQFLNVSTGISKSKGLYLQAMEQWDSTLITRPVNLANEKSGWVNIRLNYRLYTWWITNYWVQFLYTKRTGILNSEKFIAENFSQQYNFNNIFSWGKSWTADVGFIIHGRELIESMIRKPRFVINASIQTKVLDNKGTVLLGVEDLFHTWKSNYRIIGIPNVTATQLLEFDSRRIRLTFSYRFGNEKYLRKRKHNDNAADPETGRVQ